MRNYFYIFVFLFFITGCCRIYEPLTSHQVTFVKLKENGKWEIAGEFFIQNEKYISEEQYNSVDLGNVKLKNNNTNLGPIKADTYLAGNVYKFSNNFIANSCVTVNKEIILNTPITSYVTYIITYEKL